MQTFPDSTISQTIQLTDLYQQMWQWGKSRYDPELVRHRVETVDLQSRLFIVGEAHAKAQVRLTGINWFNQEGMMGTSGSTLDLILRCVGYTIRPQTKIQVGETWIGPREPHQRSAYTTEIFPSYPPSGGAPSPQQVNDALQQRFLVREIGILRPKVILLLGDKSYQAFYKYILEKETPGKISDVFEQLSPSSHLEKYDGATIIPFLHPSGASSTFTAWFKSAKDALCAQPQIKVIRDTLSHS